MRITFEFATKDDCLDKMVPSDLRVLVAERDEAESLKDHDSRSLRACNRRLINLRSEYHNKMAEMEAEIEELESFLKIDKIPEPVFPPYQPEGEGMPRYGLQWNGPEIPLSVPIDDGYWTPWHLASAENERLQARVARLELEEIGAQKAFAAVSDKKSTAESRVVDLEKSIRSLMTELHGKKRNEADQAGGGL